MPVTIRVATPADAPEVHRLILELAEYEKLAEKVRATVEDTRAAMEEGDPRIHVLLAQREAAPGAGEHAVGFALYFFTYSTFEGAPTLYLEDVFVEPSERGTGIGTQLLARLAAAARERGCRRMEWTALDWNAPAREFYENLGARPLTDWIIHRMEAAGIEAMLAREADGVQRPGVSQE
jgi:GNAT superfamily N-acetyltransferase